MCKRCMKDMINGLNTNVIDRHGNIFKSSRHPVLEYMIMPKMKCIIDFSMCGHNTQEGFQGERDFIT